MASLVFAAARKQVADGSHDWPSNIFRCILVTGAAPAGTETDVAAILAGTPSEATGGSYAAIDLIGKVAPSTVDAEFKATKITFTKPTSGPDLLGVLVMQFVANYAGSTPWFWHEFTTARTADGGTIEMRWNAIDGVGKVGEIN